MDIIFFDLDDTLCRLGKLSKESINLLGKLQKNHPEIRLAIATGRSPIMIPREIIEYLDNNIFCALVSMNGRLNYVNGQEISNYPLSQDKVKIIIDLCKKYDLTYQQLSASSISWSRRVEEFEKILSLFSAYQIDPNYYLDNHVNQVSVITPQIDLSFEQEIEKQGFYLSFWHSGGADILTKQCNKFKGVVDVCNYLNIDLNNTMAFGDGSNDIEMIQGVKMGVAMADSKEILLKNAPYVCGTIEENGIEKFLEEHKII